MKVFQIEHQKSIGSIGGTFNVLAKDAAQAIEYAQRHLKKKYYSDSEIIGLSVVTKVDVHYKS